MFRDVQKLLQDLDTAHLLAEDRQQDALARGGGGFKADENIQRSVREG